MAEKQAGIQHHAHHRRISRDLLMNLVLFNRQNSLQEIGTR